MKSVKNFTIILLLALVIAITFCLTACKKQKTEEIIPEKGLLAYTLSAENSIKMEFSVLNNIIRETHKGDISGEIKLSAYEDKINKAFATNTIKYNTAEHSESETKMTLETPSIPSESSGDFKVSLQFIDANGKEREVISMEMKNFIVQLNKDSVKCVVDQMTNEEKARLVTGYDILNEHKDLTAGTKTEGACGCTAAIERLGIPNMYMADGAAGLRIAANNTGYPSSAALASTWNYDLVEKVAASMGRDAAAFGIDLMLAPGMNIQRNPLGGRNGTYFSEDPILTGYLSSAYVNGLQSEGIGATVKHFAANNQETARGSVSANVTERALREIYLTAFEIAVDKSNPWAVMSAYNKINGDYAATKTELLTGILRDEWGFEGFVMTDWDASGDKVKIINAMNDLSTPGHDADCKVIEKALENGRISKEQIDKCCENILNAVAKSNSMKRYLGQDAPKIDGKTDKEGGAKIAEEAAAESIVMLKNDAALPFKSGEIALFGNAQNYPVASAIGAEDIRAVYRVSIQEGLRVADKIKLNEDLKEYYQYASNTIGDNLNPKEDKEELDISVERAAKAAAEADCAIVCIGRYTREGFDHRAGVGDFCLNSAEFNMIKNVSEAFHKAGKKVVVIINAGNPIEVASWRDYADAILFVGLAGQELGNAIADIITGKVNPSGKLATTFPMEYLNVPSSKSFPGNSQNVDYFEDIYVGYRFYETFDIETAYPFGFGLSYTSFEFSDISMTGSAEEGNVKISVKVKNTGKVSGKEVVQIYVRKPGTSQEQSSLELAAFAKTKNLKAGESQTLYIDVDWYAFRTYIEESSQWILEDGAYKLFIAASVEDLRDEINFEVKDKKVLRDVENRCTVAGDMQILTQAGGLPSYINKVNVALNKKASASHTESGYPAENAVDGDPTSRWSGFVPGASGNIVYEIDLGAEYDIEEIEIKWESIGSTYTIYFAGEDNEWVQVEKVTNKIAEFNKIFESEKIARFVKIEIVRNNTFTSIYDVSVYGRQ